MCSCEVFIPYPLRSVQKPEEGTVRGRGGVRYGKAGKYFLILFIFVLFKPHIYIWGFSARLKFPRVIGEVQQGRGVQ